MLGRAEPGPAELREALPGASPALLTFVAELRCQTSSAGAADAGVWPLYVKVSAGNLDAINREGAASMSECGHAEGQPKLADNLDARDIGLYICIRSVTRPRHARARARTGSQCQAQCCPARLAVCADWLPVAGCRLTRLLTQPAPRGWPCARTGSQWLAVG